MTKKQFKNLMNDFIFVSKNERHEYRESGKDILDCERWWSFELDRSFETKIQALELFENNLI
jgi:sarcosine oxidase delta subunit